MRSILERCRARRNRTFAIRTTGDPQALVQAVERAVREVDSQLAIRSMRTLDDILVAAAAPQRFRAAFIGSLAVLALALTVIGIYGVMSYMVSARTREFGIRMAIGESPGGIRRRVIGEGLRLAAVGTAVGALGALVMMRALRTFVFEVSPTDPWTLAGVVAVLGSVTLVAADGPARRAGRVDPISAIRTD